MNFNHTTSIGIVLGRKNYGEADRILTIFSEDRGRLSLLAKGVRRPKSRKRGHIEVFNLVKFQSVKAKGFEIMTEAEVVKDYKSIRGSLKKISLAYYFCEVVGKITNEYEVNTELYDNFLRFLESLEKTPKLKDLRTDFVRSVLEITGFWPKGKLLINGDAVLEEAIERQIYSKRVGKIISS